MREKISTRLSHDLFQKLMRYKDEKKISTATKAVRHILFIAEIERIEPVEDHLFVTEKSRLMVITIESPNLEKLEGLCERYGKKKSRMVREILNGYFLQKEY